MNDPVWNLVEEPEEGRDPTSTEVHSIRGVMQPRRLFATGPFPRSVTWRQDLVDKWSSEDDVAPVDHGSEEVSE